MRRLLSILLTATFVFELNSCSIDDNNGINLEFQKMQIVEAALPESFVFGNTYEIQVTYVRPDGCTYLQGFDVYHTDTTVREVVAIGARYGQSACTQAIVEVTDSFLFKVVHNQTYTFRFYTGDDGEGNPEYIETQVPVN